MTVSIIEDLAAKLRGRGSTLVLPEGTEHRVLAAARVIHDRNLARVVLLGSESQVATAAKVADVDLTGLTVLDSASAEHLDGYAEQYLELRPGTKPGVARRLVSKALFFGGSMLRAGHADAMVAGVAHATGKVIEACLLTVGKAEQIDTPSSCFLMLPGSGAAHGAMIYGDCAINVDPDAAQLADIAVASAETGGFLLDDEPRVAMLSFSSKGSGKHALARKVAEATELAAARFPNWLIDGELQVDTAIVDRVAQLKLADPGDVAGRANVLVFPDLNAGNIAYKLTQYLAGARAIGPLLQGFAHPVADLSRGASIEDIVDTAIVTLARAVDSG